MILMCLPLALAITKHVDVNVTGSFYSDLDPDGNKITLGVDSGEILDLTKHSRVLVKFARYQPVLLSPGSGWFVDGVVKTPNPDNMEGDVE